jgi:hypothetical protein
LCGIEHRRPRQFRVGRDNFVSAAHVGRNAERPGALAGEQVVLGGHSQYGGVRLIGLHDQGQRRIGFGKGPLEDLARTPKWLAMLMLMWWWYWW